MAFATGDGAVSAHEGELGLGVVEAIDVCPGFNVVAGFAAKGNAIGALAGHTIVEFTLVRILVAGGAVAVFEMERQDLVGAAGGANFMTIDAGHSNVSTGQGEARGLVLGDGEGGAVEIGNGVAGFAAIVIGSGGELVVVCVLVAIGASFKFDFVDGVFGGGEMALGALHGDVLAFQRIARGVVFLHAE